jgi:hypothetical protein
MVAYLIDQPTRCGASKVLSCASGQATSIEMQILHAFLEF